MASWWFAVVWATAVAGCAPVSPWSAPPLGYPGAAERIGGGLPAAFQPESATPSHRQAATAVVSSEPNTPAPGTGEHWRYPMQVAGVPVARAQNDGMAAAGVPAPLTTSPSFGERSSPAAGTFFPGIAPGNVVPPAVDGMANSLPPVDFDITAEEARTGRFMFGVGMNSDLGFTGQIVIDERNFDWRRFPTSWQDFINGTAWRGAGQGFRVEAMPGNQVQRYLVSFTEPYLYLPGMAEPFSLSLSGFFYDRRYFDWSEQRLGGRVALGYRITHDLSLTGALRAENVDVRDPRVVGLVPELDEVLGDNDLYTGRVTLTHDTRDTPFAATEGHLIELSYEQAFGSFDYPRGDVEYRQYFLVRERPDGSGRHTLAFGFDLGFSGSQTPLFENYFAGGFSTLRGFDFRGASPVGAFGVAVGGKFRFLGSVEYIFPITADDMLKGVVFCDYGTVERTIGIHADEFRVSPGFGLRIMVPAMGPAPLAMDLAFPVAKAPFDDVQNFSFFLGFTR